jgi:hypothetical protein
VRLPAVAGRNECCFVGTRLAMLTTLELELL